jgi:hypothetical protein
MDTERPKRQELTEQPNTLSDAELDKVTGGVNPAEAVIDYINTTTEKVIKAVQRLLR